MEKWQSLTVEQTEEKLNTSVANGLSRKEADERIQASVKDGKKNRRPLYLPKKKSILGCMLTPLLAAYMAIYLAIALFAFFGTDIYLGAWCIILLLSQICALGIINYRSIREKEKTDLYSSPSVRVIRSGVEKLTDMANIAEGDIVCFTTGDVVPCDVRLVEGVNLCVDEFVFSDKRDKLIRKRKDKNAERIYDPKTKTTYADAENMLVAGSVVIGGHGKGIVVGTGGDALLAQRLKNGELSGNPPRPAGIARLIETVKKLGIITSIALLVLTFFGMMMLRRKAFVEVFLMTLSPVLYISSVTIDIWSKHFFRSASKNISNGTVIKSNKSFDVLTGFTDVILLGHAGITDGDMHPSLLFLSGRRLDMNMIESKPDRTHRLCECIYTYLRATENKNNAEIEEYRKCFDAFLSKMDFDRAAAELKTQSLDYLEDEKNGGRYACAQIFGENISISMSSDPYILGRCKSIRVGDMPAPLDGTLKKRILDFIDECESQGEKLLFWVCEEESLDGGVLEGIVALEEHVVEHLDVVLEKYREMGVRITCLIPEESSESIKYAVQAGLASSAADRRIAFASDFAENNYQITQALGEYSVYVGFDMDSYMALVSQMKAEGRVIVSYGVDDRFNSVLNVSDLAVSCNETPHHAEEYLESFYEKIPEKGHPTSQNASDRGRLSSGILVRRSGEGGGLRGLLEAADASCRAYINLSYYLKYFAFIISGLSALVAFSAFSGLVLITPIQMLIIYLFAATVGLYAFSHATAEADYLRRHKRGYTALPKALIKRNLLHYATRTIAVFVYFAVVLVLVLTKVIERDGIAFSSFICMLFAAIYEMLRIRDEYSDSDKKDPSSAFSILFLTVIFILAFAIFGLYAFDYFTHKEYEEITVPINNVLSYIYGGQINLMSLILIPIFALILLISELVYSKFHYSVKKKIKITK